jgi:hypothetical protein
MGFSATTASQIFRRSAFITPNPAPLMRLSVQKSSNRVRNLTQKGNSPSEGIEVVGHGILVRDNLIGQGSAILGDGLLCFGDVRVRDNIIKNYGQGVRGVCSDDGGNVAY